MPEVCGAAIDVPDSTANVLPVPMPAEAMLTPGAVTSGLSQLSPVRGPPEVNDAGARNPGLAMSIGCSRAVPPSAASHLAWSSWFTPRNGMVTVNCCPVSGLLVIGPSNGGSEFALLIISTAAAPASWPKIARATRAQVPRLTTTSLPVTPALTYSFGSQPSEIVPFALRSTFTGSVWRSGNGMPLALIALEVVPVDSVMKAPGKPDVGSFAATLMTPVPEAGEPVMYGFWPLLPADATTMTPSLAALFEATADGSSALPNGEPSDMLMTSMWLLTAHSIASTVTSVEPAQPKTRTE